jgi:hypothetical protein
MKKSLLTLISFLVLTNVLFAQTNEDQLIDEIVSQVDTQELRLIVEQLSGEMPLDDGSFILTRTIGTDDKEKAADYIAEQYSNIENLVIKMDIFNLLRLCRFEKLLFTLIGTPTDALDEGLAFFIENNIRLGKNILAILKGKNRQFVFTTAHYDSLFLNSGSFEIIKDAIAPGADDNATGVAATIIAARILSQYNFTNSICFMNTDVEELGLSGSTSYVLRHIFGLNRIKSVINIDMIGYDHDNDGLMNVAYGEDSMKNTIVQEYDRLALDVDPVSLSIDALLDQTESMVGVGMEMASDYLPFYLFGVDRAVSFSEASWVSETELDRNESNPDYHSELDTVDNINFHYMTEIVKLYVATLAREAGIIGRR